MENRVDWSGAIRERSDDFDDLSVLAPLAGGSTWSGPFRAAASDGREYFVKSLDTCPPGEQASLAVEQIVAGLGRLIGAPVCTVTLMRIPSDLEGYEPVQGKPIHAGLAHASLALARAEERRPDLAFREMDNNTVRHVSLYALFDWCLGSDQQWLHDLDADQTIYSHDHGLYLPRSATGWASTDLQNLVDEPHSLPDDRAGLDPDELIRVVASLRAVRPEDLVSILNTIPVSWPVTNEDLEAVGWMLYRRASGVADRLIGT